MKTKEFIIEFSDTDPEIEKILSNKGYKKLGAGVDQTAFLEPGTGLVLKIFGTHESHLRNGMGRPEFTASQRMFKFWADYCNAHSNNPFFTSVQWLGNI